jgi:histidinol-phosphate/aromatic aminotransferase/cobyric acid decarboxylase-like protein
MQRRSVQHLYGEQLGDAVPLPPVAPPVRPQNPTGMVLSREELEEVAGILRDFPRVVAISDEVSVPAVDGRVPNSAEA